MPKLSKVDRNSMTYWWDKVKDIGNIRKPATAIYMLPVKLKLDLEGGNVANYQYLRDLDWKKIMELADQFGYPFFLRTDQSSGKHQWLETCFVKSGLGDNLVVHIANLIDSNVYGSHLPAETIQALVFRKFIPMDTAFYAFEGTPINPERRYFVRNNEVICHHPYWFLELFENQTYVKLPDGTKTAVWRLLLDEINRESETEVELLSLWASQIGRVLKGTWSVDFCRAKDQGWVFIDAATAKDSWHPDFCQHHKELREAKDE